MPPNREELPRAACLPAPKMADAIKHMNDADENQRGYSISLAPRAGLPSTRRRGEGGGV